MTIKLYDTDAYLDRFSATVLSCERVGERFATVLDATAFFPEEGGQSADGGTLGDARVLDVQIEGDAIVHYLDAPLTVGECVLGVLDFPPRLEKMQIHTAEHIVSGIIHSLWAYENVGFHLGSEIVTLDVSAPLGRDEIALVERLANDAVRRNLPVTCEYPSPERLATMTYRAKLDLRENVRVVTIGDVDACACCAPHVRRTGEIGHIRLYEFERLRGGVRIRMSAGTRALAEDQRIFLENYRVATALSVKQCETSEAVAKLQKEIAHLRYLLRESEIARMTERAEAFAPTEENPVVALYGIPIEAVRAFANTATPRTRGVLALLFGEEAEPKLLLSSATVDLKAALPLLRDSLALRGGGTPSMVQGSVGVGEDTLRAFFLTRSFL